mmetsp:Transcript_6854/g.20090  ORF Transcript_6854/g.20090 Transcript_6854/m.20090 type:complete len:261 (-) Transcript_6854:1067-1849(-)
MLPTSICQPTSSIKQPERLKRGRLRANENLTPSSQSFKSCNKIRSRRSNGKATIQFPSFSAISTTATATCHTFQRITFWTLGPQQVKSSDQIILTDSPLIGSSMREPTRRGSTGIPTNLQDASTGSSSSRMPSSTNRRCCQAMLCCWVTFSTLVMEETETTRIRFHHRIISASASNSSSIMVTVVAHRNVLVPCWNRTSNPTATHGQRLHCVARKQSLPCNATRGSCSHRLWICSIRNRRCQCRTSRCSADSSNCPTDKP